ncbi:hypothetical protein PTKIN_Ptkin13bG0227200 [Pterospermum kingtungense]
MEGFSKECDQADDDSDHPMEKLDESIHDPSEQFSEGNQASSLDQVETRTLSSEGDDDEDDINGEVDDSCYLSEGMISDDYYPLDESSLKPEGNNDYSEERDDAYYGDDDYFYDQPLEYNSFKRCYSCFPLSSVGKTHMEMGDKIIMPHEALMDLVATEISMPMQFEIQNQSTGRVSHCGVLEFTSDKEDAVFLPDWMMKNMQLQEGDSLFMKNKRLEKGTFAKLQPHTSDLLGISNPKAVLEEKLQKFSCLTMGDTIKISHESKDFYINIVETKPSAAINIIDVDCEVDFAPPLDYKEPENCAAKRKEQDEATQKLKFIPFTGLARRLDGQFCSSESGSSSLSNEQPSSAQAQALSKIITKELVFQYDRSRPQNKGKELKSEPEADTLKNKPTFQPFSGKKYTLGGCS